MNIKANNLELRDRTAEAMNRAGLATQAGMSLLLTIVAAVLYVPVAGLLILRDWIEAGAKFPEWLLPRWPFTRRDDAEAETGTHAPE